MGVWHRQLVFSSAGRLQDKRLDLSHNVIDQSRRWPVPMLVGVVRHGTQVGDEPDRIELPGHGKR